MVLYEFDSNKEAIINPWTLCKSIEVKGEMPKILVGCFEGKMFNRLVKLLNGELIAATKSANGDEPIYRVKYKGKEIAIAMFTVGASSSGAQLEELYALGVEKVIVYGSCGVLYDDIDDCSIIIPNLAVRDEGMSYHYAPPSDEIEVNKKYIPEFIAFLDELNIEYRIGKTWTTDAFYRETRSKMEKRKEQGCICVEMECSALAAVSSFREKELFQFFYTADCLDGTEWNERSLSDEVKFDEKDFFSKLAMEFALRI